MRQAITTALRCHVGAVELGGMAARATQTAFRTTCLVGALAAIPTPTKAQPRRSGATFAAIGVGYTTPLTSLGTFRSAQAELGGSPAISAFVGRLFSSRRVGVQLGSVVAVRRSITFQPAANCNGSCRAFSSSQVRVTAIGADLVFRSSPTGKGLRLVIGPWVRTYHSGKTFSVCDLDEYCASTTYFLPTDTRLGGRLGVGLDVSSGRRMLSLEVADLISSYRTNQTQHNLTVMVTIAPRM